MKILHEIEPVTQLTTKLTPIPNGTGNASFTMSKSRNDQRKERPRVTQKGQ